jgi:ABC-type uncharacterized transport system substrate-binding protein
MDSTPSARTSTPPFTITPMRPARVARPFHVEGFVYEEQVATEWRPTSTTERCPSSAVRASTAPTAAPALGVKLVAVEVSDGDYDRAFATIVAAQADALSVVASVVLSTGRQRIIQLAAKHRLPAIYDWRDHVEEGGLMAYGGGVSAFTRRAAVYVDRIFKGASVITSPRVAFSVTTW